MKSVAPLKLLDTPAKKATHTSLDTLLITPDIVRSWKNPPFQRPLKVNSKVLALAGQIKAEGGVIPGVMTLGVLSGQVYLLDGQHRREAFLLSECAEGFTDVRKHFFDNMAEMGEEFVNLNSQLVRLRPDDILRGLEGTIDGLRVIRDECAFVGYDMIRRSEKAPLLSMSTALRCWFASEREVPSASSTSALELVKRVTADEGEACSSFLKLAYASWGRDAEYVRLWGSLNLTICAWLYRRTVVTQYSPVTPKLTKETFGKCLTSLSADPSFLDWLHGRGLTERDRTPCYNRVKGIFAGRLFAETQKKAKLPTPAWVHA